MRISNINSYNFRNFAEINLSYFGKFNLIAGDNGSGKTNFLELLYFSYLFKSFRNVKENQICKTGEKFFSINLTDDLSKRKLIYVKEKGKKLNFEGEEKYKKIFIPYFNSKNMIQFYLNRLNKRYFFDFFLVIIDAEYKKKLSIYYELLKNKKFLNYKVDSNKIDYKMKEQYEIINQKLAPLIFDLIKIRLILVEYLNNFFDNLKSFFNYKILFSSQFKNLKEDEILKFLNNSFEREIKYKRYFGIHNDFYDFQKDGGKFDLLSSYADYKILYLFLNFGLISYQNEKINSYSIILFDDYLNEIDKKNLNKIKEILNDKRFNDIQVFYTISEKKLNENVFDFDKNFYIKENSIF